jgi:hypothetical protein
MDRPIQTFHSHGFLDDSRLKSTFRPVNLKGSKCLHSPLSMAEEESSSSCPDDALCSDLAFVVDQATQYFTQLLIVFL